MHLVWGVTILGGVPGLMLLAGAWLGQGLGLASAAERLAASLLAGLCAVLLALSLVGLVAPLSGWALVAVLAVVLPTLLRPTIVRALAADVRAAIGSASGRVLLGSCALFLALLLWPLLSRPGLLFYEGTANHDSFFWVVGAEHLQRHSYLQTPASQLPLDRAAGYIAGLQAEWGRMGAEGYLALVAGLTRQSPLAVYLWTGAALFAAWCAAVYAITRSFITEQLGWKTLLALGLLQPIFAFYQHNSNLPNLLGMLCGATLVFACEQLMRLSQPTTGVWWRWVGLAALALHGVLVSYPEIAPFVLLPCALLVLRGWRRGTRRITVYVAAISLGAVLLNPVSSVRAVRGFVIALDSARENGHRPDFLAKLEAAQAGPALLTLSAKTGRELGVAGGALTSLGLAVVFGYVFWRARDRRGLACVLSGAAVLLGYTLLTDFHYGWQKTMQFAGVFLAANCPVGALALLARERRGRRLALAAATGLGVFFLYALAMVQLDLRKWSQRKFIDADFPQLAAAADQTGATAPLIVDGATFQFPFFHGMWAARLFAGHPLIYAGRDPFPGGYLHAWVEREQKITTAGPVLVGRAWADEVDSTAPRLAGSGAYVLLAHANRVVATDGIELERGQPRAVAAEFSLQVVARAATKLEISIVAPESASGTWELRYETPDAAGPAQRLTLGAGVWRGVVDLAPEVVSTVRARYRAEEKGAPPPAVSFPLERLRFVTSSR